jgi:hypothetical protein
MLEAPGEESLPADQSATVRQAAQTDVQPLVLVAEARESCEYGDCYNTTAAGSE